MVLWPLFGTTNQLTAGLSLLIITIILWRLGRKFIYALIPLIVVVTATSTSMVINISTYLQEGNALLVIVGTIIFALNIWLILEGIAAVRRERQNPIPPMTQ